MTNYLWDIDNEDGYKNKMGYYKTHKELQFIKDNVSGTHLKILDIGGGSGRFATELIKDGHDVVLLDPDINAISMAKNIGVMNTCCGFIDDIKEENFDMAICIEAIVWVKNIDDFFKAVSSKLKKEGVFVFTITNINSWRYKAKKSIHKGTAYNHVSFDVYKNLAAKNNLLFQKKAGFMWLPFRVNSNSKLIPLFIWIEKLFFLNKWISQSPWIIVSAKKI